MVHLMYRCSKRGIRKGPGPGASSRQQQEAYADVCWRMLTDVCWHMLTYAYVSIRQAVASSRQQEEADGFRTIFERERAYARCIQAFYRNRHVLASRGRRTCATSSSWSATRQQFPLTHWLRVVISTLWGTLMLTYADVCWRMLTYASDTLTTRRNIDSKREASVF
jgi:hypothetical protein